MGSKSLKGLSPDGLLYTQALFVTAGPFEGRICENDDNEFVGIESLRESEKEWMNESGIQYETFEDDGEEYVGVDCEIVTFGRYITCRGYHIIPRQFLRPATMKDLVGRISVINGIIVHNALALYDEPHDDGYLKDTLLEHMYISEEIRERELAARSKTTSGKNVFLCHASSDKPYVRQVCTDLGYLGHNPWVDEFEIKVGESIVDKIQSAKESADAIVIFLSQASLDSSWVKREWQSSLAQHLAGSDVMLLPAMIEQVNLPALLCDIKYANFVESYERGLNEISEALA